MFGTLLSNDLLAKRIDEGSIEIRPFNRQVAQAAHYPLEPATVYRREGKGWKKHHEFGTAGDIFQLNANEYVIVEISQRVKLKQGLVGVFVPASNLIEEGFGLVSGKITAPFGNHGEAIRFGLKNYLDEPNRFDRTKGLAYLQIFDLTGLPLSEYVLTRRDLAVYSDRRTRADDDGVYSVTNMDEGKNF